MSAAVSNVLRAQAMWSGLQRERFLHVQLTFAIEVCKRETTCCSLALRYPPHPPLCLGFDMQLCELSVSVICGQLATDDSRQNT